MACSPVSKYPPINARLCEQDWRLTVWLLKCKLKELRKTRFGQAEKQVWIMTQIEHLRALKQNNLPYILGELLNSKTDGNQSLQA